MKKLKLNLEDLKVESYEITTANQPIKGTVKGLACSGDDTDPTSFCQCPSAGCGATNTCVWNNTCANTCPDTCVNTCAHTCDDPTCAQSCNGTCGGSCPTCPEESYDICP